MRLNKAGYNTAMVVARSNLVNILITKGRLKIGWVSYRVREKEEVKKCFRCMELGHEAWNCKRVDRPGCCFRCGEEGHIAAECKGTEKCSKCQAEGYRTGSQRCSEFNKNVNRKGGYINEKRDGDRCVTNQH